MDGHLRFKRGKETKMIKIFNRKFAAALLAAAMALTLVVGFGAPAFATAEEDGIATIEFIVYGETLGWYDEDEVYHAAYEIPVVGETLYDALNNYFGDDEALYGNLYPVWEGNNPYPVELGSFIGCDKWVDWTTVYPDNSGISAGDGWIYTVNGTMPAFPGSPVILKAMNQYVIEDGDEIVLNFDYWTTTWNSDGEITSIT
jgi:hypothetical protein